MARLVSAGREKELKRINNNTMKTLIIESDSDKVCGNCMSFDDLRSRCDSAYTSIVNCFKHNTCSFHIDKREFLNSENTEGTSDATSNVLHLQDSSRTEPARSGGDDVSQASVDGPFKNRTDGGNYCRAYSCTCQMGKDVFKCSNDCKEVNQRQ